MFLVFLMLDRMVDSLVVVLFSLVMLGLKILMVMLLCMLLIIFCICMLMGWVKLSEMFGKLVRILCSFCSRIL